MRYGVLGPFEVHDDDRMLDLGRPKQRAVLAVLLLEANHVVSLDRLIDLVWGDGPARPIHRLAPGLRLQPAASARARTPARTPRRSCCSPDHRATCSASSPASWTHPGSRTWSPAGRRLLDEGRPVPARSALEEALALWRGDALAEFAYEKFARPAIARWEELRLLATEDLVQADLAVGAHGPAIATLEGLVARFPLRERLWGLLMVALYRDGRQGEALGPSPRLGPC